MYATKRHLFAGLALLSMVAFSAHAGMPSEPNPCGNHGNNCEPQTPSDPGNQTQTNDQTQTQGQGQAQGQLQGQDQTANGGNGTGVGVGYGAGGDGGSALAGSASNSGAAATGGDAASDARSTSGSTSGAASNSGGNRLNNDSTSSSAAYSGGNSVSGINAASADGSGNSSVTVDAADRSSNSYTSQSLWLPQIETTAPAYVASPNIQIIPGVCGPRVKRISERVEGTYVGIIKKSNIPLGTDDVAVELESEPFRYHQGQNGVLVEGSRVQYAVFAVGVAAGRSIGLGGGETGGNWGQGGASSNSSMQRPIIRALITPCLMELAKPDTPASNDGEYFEPTVNG